MFEIDVMTDSTENTTYVNEDMVCAPDSPSGGDCDNGFDCWP